MPRPGPPRPTITIRLHRYDIDRLDRLAEEQHTTRSELVRKAIALLPASMGATSPPAGKNDQGVVNPPMHGPMDPVHPCREMPTRHCPAIYQDVCGEDRICARLESEDETPWHPELP